MKRELTEAEIQQELDEKNSKKPVRQAVDFVKDNLAMPAMGVAGAGAMALKNIRSNTEVKEVTI